MIDGQDHGLVDGLQRIIGGGATSFLAGVAGRLMWHVGEVRAKRRPVLSWALCWELPLAFGMALIGDGLGDYLGLTDTATIGVITTLSYFGPRGAGAFLERWLEGKR